MQEINEAPLALEEGEDGQAGGVAAFRGEFDGLGLGGFGRDGSGVQEGGDLAAEVRTAEGAGKAGQRGGQSLPEG